MIDRRSCDHCHHTRTTWHTGARWLCRPCYWLLLHRDPPEPEPDREEAA